MTLRFTDDEFRDAMKNTDLSVAGGMAPLCLTKTAEKSVLLDMIPNEPESDFQKRLIKLLQENGWLVCEFGKARVRKGGQDVYRTPFRAGGRGFPDLVAVRPPRVLFIENKSAAGQASPEQVKWLVLLGKCPGVEVYCWRPADWEKILEVIK